MTNTDVLSAEELLPCPFCGIAGRSRIVPFDGEPYFPGFMVRCNASGWDGDPRKGCGATTGWAETEAAAISAWNRRSHSRASGVKALGWVDDAETATASALGITYNLFSRNGVWKGYADGHANWFLDHVPTLEAAKSAAQSHFNASIQSCLVAEGVEPRPLVDQLTGALRFILAFYEPGQTYLDTNAWKVAEAGGRAALAKGEAFLTAQAAEAEKDAAARREALSQAQGEGV